MEKKFFSKKWWGGASAPQAPIFLYGPDNISILQNITLYMNAFA